MDRSKGESGRKKAFTYVELLISMIIIGLLAIAGTSSFQTFFSKQEMAHHSQRLQSIIDSLNNDIDSQEISSFSIGFYSGAYAVVTDTDFYNAPTQVTLTGFDFTSLSGNLVTNNTSSGLWTSKLYVDNIYRNTMMANGSGDSMNLNLGKIEGFDNIKIIGEVDGIPTNTLTFYHLTSFTDPTQTDDKIYINDIRSATPFDQIIYQNILGKKKIRLYTSTGSVDINSGSINLTKGSKEILFLIK